MSGDSATWRVLLDTRPQAEVLLRWVRIVASHGLHVQDTVWVVLATGEGALPFSEVTAAAQFAVDNGGLITLRGEWDDELSISVHVRGSSLETELEAMGEPPQFDEIHVDISARAAARRGSAWRAFESSVLTACADDNAGVFAWCASDSLVEAMVPVRVHEEVASGRVPSLRAMAVAVPSGLALADSLRARAPSLNLEFAAELCNWQVYRSTQYSDFGLL